MKFIVSFLLMICFVAAHAQNISVKISTGKNSFTVFTDSANDNKVLIIKKFQTGYLKINVGNEDSAWKRNFFMDDEAGNTVEEVVLIQPDIYCISIKKLIQSLQVAKTYFLYMSSLPKDPQKAMLVKVALKLICKIKLEN